MHALNSTPRQHSAWAKVPHPVDVARRLRALVSIGYSEEALASRLGVELERITLITRSSEVTHEPPTSEEVRRLFSTLWTQPVTGPDGDASRELAQQMGWVGPLAWDDIDDPSEQPNITGSRLARGDKSRRTYVDEIAVEKAVRGERVKLTRVERLVAITRLHSRKWSDSQIARRLAITEAAVARYRSKHGLSAWTEADEKKATTA